MVIAVVVLVVVVGSDRLRVNPRPDRENSVPRRACFLLYIDYRYIDILNTKHIDKKRDTCIHRSRVVLHGSRVVLHSTRHNASEEPIHLPCGVWPRKKKCSHVTSATKS